MGHPSGGWIPHDGFFIQEGQTHTHGGEVAGLIGEKSGGQPTLQLWIAAAVGLQCRSADTRGWISLSYERDPQQRRRRLELMIGGKTVDTLHENGSPPSLACA